MFDTKPVLKNSRELLVYGKQKVGKGTALAQLPNSIIIDFQRGYSFIEHPAKVNILDLLEETNAKFKAEGKAPLNIVDITKAISDKIEKGQYDYIILDTYTNIEDMAWILATRNYKSTAMGKSFADTSVASLPKGAGYFWLREAVEQIIDLFRNKANICLIIVGHIKDAELDKDDSKTKTTDLDAAGKLKIKIPSDVDSVGKMYKKDKNTVMLSFISDETNGDGSRSEHLRGKEFVLSELKDNKIVTHWENIFIT